MPVFRHRRPLVEARCFSRDHYTVEDMLGWGDKDIHFTDYMEWWGGENPGYFCHDCGRYFFVEQSSYSLVVSNADGDTLVRPGGWVVLEPTAQSDWKATQFRGYTPDEFWDRYESES